MRQTIDHITRRVVRSVTLSLTFLLIFTPPGGASAEYVPALSVAGTAGSSGKPHQRDTQQQTLWLELEDYKPLQPAAAEEPRDLLARLRAGFSIEAAMNNHTQAHLDWFVRHPEYLERVFNRAQRYMPYIVDELDKRGLPLELALLPIVESAYDPFAYSHGRAAGLWQIIPGTAKRFGIRQNWWYDGRRDVVDSTNGALSYLAYLHDLMDGDWLLAVASYNSGEGNVLRAARRNRDRRLPTDFWHLKLPKETISYVPKLLALVELVRDPAAFGIELPELLDTEQFAQTDVGGQLDLALAAELAGVDVDTLYAFNAGFNHWATDPEGPHRLVLPAGVSEAFNEALAALPEDERVRWQRHKVRPGETLSEIAGKYRTTIAAIRGANGIGGNTIRAGAYLTVPVASKPLSEYSQSADARLAKTQNREHKGNRVEHRVSSGESFWSIGRRYGVGMRQLAGWNGMAPRDTLSVGQKLVVWTNDTAPTSAPAGNDTTRKLRYTVRNGDSLYLIANRFRITISDLVRWNSIDRNKILRPGQTLTMYVDVTRQSG
ncbi:MAG: LysM peptidoglycan-binding domain-containing protein [Woeseia sp.]